MLHTCESCGWANTTVANRLAGIDANAPYLCHTCYRAAQVDEVEESAATYGNHPNYSGDPECDSCGIGARPGVELFQYDEGSSIGIRTICRVCFETMDDASAQRYVASLMGRV